MTLSHFLSMLGFTIAELLRGLNANNRKVRPAPMVGRWSFEANPLPICTSLLVSVKIHPPEPRSKGKPSITAVGRAALAFVKEAQPTHCQDARRRDWQHPDRATRQRAAN